MGSVGGVCRRRAGFAGSVSARGRSGPLLIWRRVFDACCMRVVLVLYAWCMRVSDSSRHAAPLRFRPPFPCISQGTRLRILLGQKQAPVESDDSPASAASVEDDCKDRMEKSLESVKRNFDTISTGRANPKMLDRVTVDYYGTPTPLNQMASVTTPESCLVVIQPYDISAIPDIERAILGSDVDITPSNDGKVIRLQVPQLTAERRKEMTKVAGKMGEEGKVAIRNVRRDMLKKVEKLADEVGEDGKKDLDDKVQKLTDSFISSVDALLKSKNEELLKV